MSRTLRPTLSLLALLAAGLAGPAAPARAGDDDLEILQFLASTGADPNGTCRARWRQDEGGTDFNVELEDVAPGAYELWVAGADQGTVQVGALGEGELEFANPKDGNKPLLDFAVLDQLIEVKQGATTFFSDVFDGSGTGGGGGGGGGADAKLEVFMVNVGPDLNAKGRLRHELEPAKVRFDLEVENLDAGTYQLLVAGAPVAEFTADGVETEVEFQDPVEPGKVLLNFDPLGQQVDVAAGGVTYLTAVLPAAGTGAPPKGQANAKDLGKKKGDALQVALMNSGLQPGAHGTVKLSQSGQTELEVEVDDLADGQYGLAVAGAPVGTLVVTAGQGQLEFSTSPGAGQLLLDFPVQGQLVEVTAGADTLLSVVFPLSVQAALGTFVPEVHTEQQLKLNVVPSGADLDARGLAVFKDKPPKDTLKVTVRDLDPGSYDLRLDGSLVGVLVVTKADGKAKLVLSTAPKGSQAPLDAPVQGALLQVTPAGEPGTVLLAVVME